VAHRSHQAVVVARKAFEGAAQQAVGLALSVGVGGQDGVDAGVRTQQGGQALVVDWLTEVHESAAAPGAHGHVSGIAHGRQHYG